MLDGLEVRWGLVVRALQALTRLGPWRGDNTIGPMHKWYDPRLFDVLPEKEVRWKCAPKVWRGELVEQDHADELQSQGEQVEAVDVRTAAELHAAGFEVRHLGAEDSDLQPEGSSSASDALLEPDVFSSWLLLQQHRLG